MTDRKIVLYQNMTDGPHIRPVLLHTLRRIGTVPHKFDQIAIDF